MIVACLQKKKYQGKKNVFLLLNRFCMEAAFYCIICSCKILPVVIGCILNCRIRYIVVIGNAPSTAIYLAGVFHPPATV